MKPILVHTDFSKCSYNATLYAIALAKETKAKIILFHAHQNPIPATAVPLKELLENKPCMESLRRLKDMAEIEMKFSAKIVT